MLNSVDRENIIIHKKTESFMEILKQEKKQRVFMFIRVFFDFCSLPFLFGVIYLCIAQPQNYMFYRSLCLSLSLLFVSLSRLATTGYFNSKLSEFYFRYELLSETISEEINGSTNPK